MNDRPHPGLLPQEKEKRSPRLGEADALGCRAVSPATEKETALMQGSSKFSRDVQNFSLSPRERARVRASVKSISCFVLLFCFAFVSPLLADDVITNIMSPIASYQYPENFSSAVLTNGGILSPIASYQYYEWPGNDVLNLQSSPQVSYYYQFLDAPLFNILPPSRVPTTAESTPAYLLSTPPQSQLEIFCRQRFYHHPAISVG